MRSLSRFIPRSNLRLAVLSVLCISGAVTPACAGFEWIPGSNAQAPQAPAGTMQPQPPGAAPTVPVAMPENTLEPRNDEPMAQEEDGRMLPLPLMGMSEKSQPAMQTRKMESPSSLSEADKMPPMQPVIRQRVMMPNDAPTRAVDTLQSQKGNVLQINPFPEKAQMPATAQAPMPMEPAMKEPPMQKTATTQDGPSMEPVQGFGSDMPLAMALRQVVPPQYAFSFAQSVNPGYRVSWTGGKPWIEVVQDMLQPLGLRAELHGKTLHIASNTQAAVQSADPVAVPRRNILDPGTAPALQSPAPEKQAQAPSAAPQDEPSIQAVWTAHEGDSLKNTLQGWSRSSGFDLVWDADYDYKLKADMRTQGPLQDALRKMSSEALDSDNAPSFMLVASPESEDRPKLVIRNAAAG